MPGNVLSKESFGRNERSHGILLQALLVVTGCLSCPVWHEVLCVEAEAGSVGASPEEDANAFSLEVAWVRRSLTVIL